MSIEKQRASLYPEKNAVMQKGVNADPSLKQS